MPADFPSSLLIANAAPLSVILRRRILTILDELGGAGDYPDRVEHLIAFAHGLANHKIKGIETAALADIVHVVELLDRLDALSFEHHRPTGKE